MRTALGGGGLGSVAPRFVSFDPRRGVDSDAREAGRSHQKDWSAKGWAKACFVWVKWLGGRHRKNLRAFNGR